MTCNIERVFENLSFLNTLTLNVERKIPSTFFFVFFNYHEFFHVCTDVFESVEILIFLEFLCRSIKIENSKKINDKFQIKNLHKNFNIKFKKINFKILVRNEQLKNWQVYQKILIIMSTRGNFKMLLIVLKSHKKSKTCTCR